MYVPYAVLENLLNFHYDCRKRIYDSVESLTEKEFVTPIAPHWSSAHNVLLHCLRAEMFWIQHGILGGERPRHDTTTYPTLKDVRDLGLAVQEGTRRFAAELDEADFGIERSVQMSDGSTVTFTADQAILHVVLHDVHHRGELVAYLKQLGHEPPMLDLLTRDH